MPGDQAKTLRDARLLLEDFSASAWRDLEVISGVMRLSISRLSAIERARRAAAALPPASASSSARVGETVLTAPHVATLRELAPAGATLQIGGVYATLSLLDESIEIVANQTMRVVSSLSKEGELLEFGAPLLLVDLVKA